MSEEWNESDSDSWKGEGEKGSEEEILSIIDELDEFNLRPSLHKDDLEMMLMRIDRWRYRFFGFHNTKLKKMFDDAVLVAEIKIGKEFLEIFNEIENPPEDICKIMDRLLDILQNNLDKAIATSSPEVREAFNKKMDIALMKIAGTYPDILE